MKHDTYLPPDLEGPRTRMALWDSYGDGLQQRATHTSPHDRDVALRSLGSVVYAVRVAEGLIKIGCTTNLAARRCQLQGEMLAFAFGDYNDEQEIHASLVEHLHHAREWYHPTPQVLTVVNAMRDDLGLPHLTA